MVTMIRLPFLSWSTWRNGAPYVVRCPAMAVVPPAPGKGVCS
jgi:hypothetical protein